MVAGVSFELGDARLLRTGSITRSTTSWRRDSSGSCCPARLWSWHARHGRARSWSSRRRGYSPNCTSPGLRWRVRCPTSTAAIWILPLDDHGVPGRVGNDHRPVRLEPTGRGCAGPVAAERGGAGRGQRRRPQGLPGAAPVRVDTPGLPPGQPACAGRRACRGLGLGPGPAGLAAVRRGLRRRCSSVGGSACSQMPPSNSPAASSTPTFTLEGSPSCAYNARSCLPGSCATRCSSGW